MNSATTPEIILDPKQRVFPPFSLSRLLQTVFDPIQGKSICILIDLEDPHQVKDFAYLNDHDKTPQWYAYHTFYQGLHQGVMDELNLSNGDFFAYEVTGGSNLDLNDLAVCTQGNEVSLEKDIYPHYDIILCISTYSATAPLTAFCKQYGFRGATMHGVNECILNSGLAVDYHEVSRDSENLRLAMTKADEIEIDFAMESGEIHTLTLYLEGQEAQKSHGLCQGEAPDVANLPAGEVYFVPTDAEGTFPMKYDDGTISILTVNKRRITGAQLLSGNQETVDAHNAKLSDDPKTGDLGELGFGTQVFPVAYADIQDEKALGTCHIATGRDDHLGGDIIPSMFKDPKNASHDDILFAPHKTPNIDLKQVRMKRGEQQEILLEHYRPSTYLLDALRRE